MSALTVPELDRLVKAKRWERHFEAMRWRWALSVLSRLIPWCVAAGYRMGRSAKHIEPLRLDELLKGAPGYDRELSGTNRARHRG